MRDQGRDISLDIAKGLGIIAVVVGHAVQVEHSAMTPLSELIYSFHMPLFFIIGGILFRPPQRVSFYAVKRTIQLMLPYCVFLLFAVLLPLGLKWIFGHTPLVDLIRPFLLALAGGQGAPQIFWFVSCYWITSILFAYLIKRSGRGLVPIVLMIFVFGYVPAFFLPNFWLPLGLNVVPVCLLYFCIGYILAPYLKSVSRRRRIFCAASAILILLVVQYNFVEHISLKYADYGTPVFSVLAAVPIGLAVLFLADILSRHEKISKILAYIGTASAIVMYVHMPAMYFMLGFGLNNVFQLGLISFVVGMVVFVLAGRFSVGRFFLMGDLADFKKRFSHAGPRDV